MLMKNLFLSIQEHKKLAVFFLSIFLIVFFLIFSPFQNQSKQIQVEKNINQTTTLITTTTKLDKKDVDTEDPETPYEQMASFEKKEDFGEKGVFYFFTSSINNRPNLIVVKNGIVVFERSLVEENNSLSIAKVVELFGNPDRIVSGPSFYQKATQYLYEEAGYCAVFNPTTGLVYERHFFPPEFNKEYLKTYAGL
jgi:hypothetical protein